MTQSTVSIDGTSVGFGRGVIVTSGTGKETAVGGIVCVDTGVLVRTGVSVGSEVAVGGVACDGVSVEGRREGSNGMPVLVGDGTIVGVGVR